jgi:hypothetical protein
MKLIFVPDSLHLKTYDAKVEVPSVGTYPVSVDDNLIVLYA